MTGSVQPEWIDYNGHMNYAYFVVAFDRATDVLFDRIGIGTEYRAGTNRTLYVVETHVVYLKELKGGEVFSVETVIGDADGKRLHLYQRLLNEAHEVCATSEVLCLNVDQSGERPRAVRFEEKHSAAIQDMMARQSAHPKELGRSIRVRGNADRSF